MASHNNANNNPRPPARRRQFLIGNRPTRILPRVGMYARGRKPFHPDAVAHLSEQDRREHHVAMAQEEYLRSQGLEHTIGKWSADVAAGQLKHFEDKVMPSDEELLRTHGPDSRHFKFQYAIRLQLKLIATGTRRWEAEEPTEFEAADMKEKEIDQAIRSIWSDITLHGGGRPDFERLELPKANVVDKMIGKYGPASKWGQYQLRLQLKYPRKRANRNELSARQRRAYDSWLQYRGWTEEMRLQLEAQAIEEDPNYSEEEGQYAPPTLEELEELADPVDWDLGEPPNEDVAARYHTNLSIARHRQLAYSAQRKGYLNPADMENATEQDDTARLESSEPVFATIPPEGGEGLAADGGTTIKGLSPVMSAWLAGDPRKNHATWRRVRLEYERDHPNEGADPAPPQPEPETEPDGTGGFDPSEA